MQHEAKKGKLSLAKQTIALLNVKNKLSSKEAPPTSHYPTCIYQEVRK